LAEIFYLEDKSYNIMDISFFNATTGKTQFLKQGVNDFDKSMNHALLFVAHVVC